MKQGEDGGAGGRVKWYNNKETVRVGRVIVEFEVKDRIALNLETDGKVVVGFQGTTDDKGI